MGRWLNELRKNLKTPGGGTDKTDKTPPTTGFVSSVGRLPGHLQNFPDFSGWDDDDWQFAFEERAAILEFDEGLSRPEAEALAADQTAEQRWGNLLDRRAGAGRSLMAKSPVGRGFNAQGKRGSGNRMGSHSEIFQSRKMFINQTDRVKH